MPTLSPPQEGLSLYNRALQRLYINATERERFIAAAQQLSPLIRAFCLTLVYTGCRISEVRELNHQALQSENRSLSVRSLKKRDRHHIREVPIPQELVDILMSLERSGDELIWSLEGEVIPRITAYRWVKQVMSEAGIEGPHACPKGLRHGYGIHAIRSGVPLNMLQKWMGHTSMTTTALYANAMGREELEIADRMWS